MSLEQGRADPLDLEQQLCYALSIAARGVVAAYKPLLDPLGLTHPQYLAMVALWQHGPLQVKELGALLSLDSGTLSPLLKRLETLGLVERRRSGEDERRVAIHLTPAGRNLSGPASAIPQRLADAAGLSLEELEQLRTTLGKLTAALHESL